MSESLINKYLNPLITLCLAIIVLASCSTTKRTAGKAPDAEVERLDEAYLLSGLMGAMVQEDWMQAKAKVSANLNGDKYDVATSIYYKKDELVMVSARMLGFELARLFITPDSALVLNRLERTYLSYDMEGLSRLVGFPINMDIIQDMLMGNPYLGEDIKWNPADTSGLVKMQTTNGSVIAENQIQLPDFKLTRSIFQDRGNKRTLNSLFSQYQQYKDDNYFSYFRTYELNSAQDGEMFLEITFTSIEWDTPFNVDMSIPSRYRKMF